jgi:hypothetical protein
VQKIEEVINMLSMYDGKKSNYDAYSSIPGRKPIQAFQLMTNDTTDMMTTRHIQIITLEYRFGSRSFFCKKRFGSR